MPIYDFLFPNRRHFQQYQTYLDSKSSQEVLLCLDISNQMRLLCRTVHATWVLIKVSVIALLIYFILFYFVILLHFSYICCLRSCTGQKNSVDHLGNLVLSKTFTSQEIIIPGELVQLSAEVCKLLFQMDQFTCTLHSFSIILTCLIEKSYFQHFCCCLFPYNFCCWSTSFHVSLLLSQLGFLYLNC